jgi:hypothetical protein
MVACLAMAGVASAATSPQLRLKPGTSWTQTNLQDNGCEVLLFGSGDTFTANRANDAGTYTSSGKSITITWTAGNDKGQTLKAHWSTKDNEYKGKGNGGLGGGTKWKTTIVKGSLPNC